MANRATVKVGPAIDAALYKKFVAVAQENGEMLSFLNGLLEQLSQFNP